MENNKLFEKTKEILKLLEGLNYYECKGVVESVTKNLKYRKNNNSFIYEELQVG